MNASPTHGLLSGVFDLSFDKLVTPKVIKFIYVMVLLFSAITYLGYTAFAFQVSAGLGILVLVIIGPLAFLVTAILWRMVLELAIAIFKIAENTGRIAGPVSTAVPPSSTPSPAGNPTAPPST